MSGPLRGRRVLVLEDSALIAMELEDVIVRLGASSVIACASAADAARIAERERVDLALCDVNVRDGSSLALVEALRARGVRCALLTGYAELPDEGARLAGVPLLQKPLTPADLARALTDLLGADAEGD